MALQTASVVYLAAFLSRCLSLAKSISIGFRSGEYFRQEEELGAGFAEGVPDGLAPHVLV